MKVEYSYSWSASQQSGGFRERIVDMSQTYVIKYHNETNKQLLINPSHLRIPWSASHHPGVFCTSDCNENNRNSLVFRCTKEI